MTDCNPRYCDACENCGRYDVAPESGIADGVGGLVVAYRCPACRAGWICSWGIVPGRIMPPPPKAGGLLGAVTAEQAAINRAHRHLAPKEPT